MKIRGNMCAHRGSYLSADFFQSSLRIRKPVGSVANFYSTHCTARAYQLFQSVCNQRTDTSDCQSITTDASSRRPHITDANAVRKASVVTVHPTSHVTQFGVAVYPTQLNHLDTGREWEKMVRMFLNCQKCFRQSGLISIAQKGFLTSCA